MEEGRNRNVVFHILIRVILCITVIYFTNRYIAAQGISAAVGMNGVTLLTSAALGIPGVLLLYGILLYQNL